MDNNLIEMYNSYISSSHISVEKCPDSHSLSLTLANDKGKAVIYTLWPGIDLIYFDICTSSLPGDTKENTALELLQFNYCVNGRIEMSLDDTTYIYLKENDFCISKQSSRSDSFFPAKQYQGVTLYFDMNLLRNPDNSISEVFNLNFSLIPEIYLCKLGTYIAQASGKIEKTLSNLWSLFYTPSLFYMRLYVVEILHLLLEGDTLPAKACSFYTNVQVALAKKVEEILTADLRSHIPVRVLAEQLSVSETSLKNYFRGVYGRNISDYLRTMRMDTAARLLTGTTLSIAEISVQVGYAKQGKFAAVFRQQFHMNPLEYRRIKRLEN